MYRSLLFIPGNNPSMIQNADVFLADALIFDLEDSVAIDEKDNARNLIGNFLKTRKILAKEIVLRINPVDSKFYQGDLGLLAMGNVDAVLLPKASVSSLRSLEKDLVKIEKKYQLKEIKVIALIEKAASVIEADEIAKNDRVEALFLGAEDLCNDLEIDRTKDNKEIFYARSRIIYAATANKKIPIDTPYTEIDNDKGLEADCKQAFALGMKAKSCIHPNQLEIVNRVFSPTVEQIVWAKKVLSAYEENKALGKGAFKVDGKMIDKPIVEKANKIIQKAKKYNLM